MKNVHLAPFLISSLQPGYAGRLLTHISDPTVDVDWDVRRSLWDAEWDARRSLWALAQPAQKIEKLE